MRSIGWGLEGGGLRELVLVIEETRSDVRWPGCALIVCMYVRSTGLYSRLGLGLSLSLRLRIRVRKSQIHLLNKEVASASAFALHLQCRMR